MLPSLTLLCSSGSRSHSFIEQALNNACSVSEMYILGLLHMQYQHSMYLQSSCLQNDLLLPQEAY